ncbi:MAG TPA: NAD-dependent epimerase/dehydratase family protein, partial [Planctomycetota bacterium]|nr:NAD-dependent epimerase/dehydratase family protein [Planctomycetota bacterium]
MATYLVTGGAGFIGSHVVEALLARGARVRVLDDYSTGKPENLAGFRGALEVIGGRPEGDLTDFESVKRAAEGVDAIFHLGARPSVPRSFEELGESTAANIAGTTNVLRAAKVHGVKRIVYSSSSSVYGDAPKLPKQETDTGRPLSPYATQKLVGEHYARFAKDPRLGGLEVVSLRYFNVFGPRQDPNSYYSGVIAKFIRMMLKGEPPTIRGDGTQSRDFTYVENVVAANLLALEAPGERVAGEPINVACGTRITVLELVGAIARILGRKDLAPVYVPKIEGDIEHSQADISKARELLGFQPKVDFAEGLER